jgi:hypothetical protein
MEKRAGSLFHRIPKDCLRDNIPFFLFWEKFPPLVILTGCLKLGIIFPNSISQQGNISHPGNTYKLGHTFKLGNNSQLKKAPQLGKLPTMKNTSLLENASQLGFTSQVRNAYQLEKLTN